MSAEQKKLQELSDEYQNLQTSEIILQLIPVTTKSLIYASSLDLSAAVQARQKLESQQQENQNVQKVVTSPQERLSMAF
jgi:hypothetical protein